MRSHRVTLFSTVASLLLLAVLPLHAQNITTIAGGAPVTSGPGLLTSIGPITSVAEDGSGNLYFVTPTSYVYKLDTAGNLTILAGNGAAGYSGDTGPATAATLALPQGIAVDAAGTHIYVADTGNEVIRLIFGGNITTFAGTGSPIGTCTPGAAPLACSLHQPQGLFVASSGDLYIADAKNHVIRKVSAGAVTTVAGNGSQGFSGDGSAATAASLDTPSAVWVDAALNIFIADTNNQRVREVTKSNGNISTVGGGGGLGLFGQGTGSFSGDTGPATSATLNQPQGVFVDGVGDVFVADTNNNVIRKFTVGGSISTVVGNTSAASLSTITGFPFAGFSGDAGPATSATLSEPFDVVGDSTGNLFIADSVNHRIRQVDSTGTINTVAGNGNIGSFVAPTSANLALPYGVVGDSSGNLYISDYANDVIRKIFSGTQTIGSVAGSGIPGQSGDGGTATSAEFNFPQQIAVDTSGNVFIADSDNFAVRELSGSTLTTVAGTLGRPGAPLANVEGVAVDTAGNVYIADPGTSAVLMLDPTHTTLSLLAGNPGFPCATPTSSCGDGMAATSASLNSPGGVAVDPVSGNIYIADTRDNKIRVVFGGNISTLAGTGSRGFSGDGGLATAALLNRPQGVAVDSLGNVYISDTDNSLIREVYCPTAQPGCVVPTPFVAGDINTVAGFVSPVSGLPVAGFSGDGGPATAAMLAAPSGLFLDAVNNLYIADTANSRIRVVGPAGPGIMFNPTTLSFPAAGIPVGQQSSVNLTITNTGTAPLQITGITVQFAPDNFSLPNAVPQWISPGQSITFPVVYRPDATGPVTANLSISDNATGSPHSVSLVGMGNPPVGCTNSWIGGPTGNWLSSVTNWSRGVFPDMTDTACIVGNFAVTMNGTATVQNLYVAGTVSGTLTITGGGVTLNSAASNATIGNLSLNGGTLDGQGTVQIGTFNSSGGTLGGATQVVDVLGRATITTAPLTDGGTVRYDGTTTINTTLNLAAGLPTAVGPAGTFTLQSTSMVTGGAGSQFVNAGTLSIPSGSNWTIGVPMTNTGILKVASGTLTLSQGTLNSGSMLVSAGGTLNLGGSSTITGVFGGPGGTGIVNITGVATFTALNSAPGPIGTLNISGAGATVNLAGTTLAATTVNVTSGGSLSGIGTIQGSVVNTSGTVMPLLSSPGLGTLAFTIVGNYTQGAGGFLSAAINNLPAGTGYAQLAVTGSATLGGTLLPGTTGSYVASVAAAGQKFALVRAGTLSGTFATVVPPTLPAGLTASTSYTATPGTALLTINPAAACVNWTGPMTGGNWSTAANWSGGAVPGTGQDACLGAANILIDSSLAMANQSINSFTGTGTLTITNVSGPFTIASTSSIGNLTIGVGSGLSGAGNLTVSGLFTWSGSPMAGTGTTSANGGMAVSFGGGSPSLGRMLINGNNGTATFNGVNFAITAAGTFVNNSGSTIDIQSDGVSLGVGGNTGTITNAGTIKKSGGTGAGSSIDVNLNSTGTIAVNSGTLVVDTVNGMTSATISGPVTVAPTATFGFNAVTATVSGPVSGAGSVTETSSTVTFTGAYSISGTTAMTNATVNFNSPGTITSIGPVTINNTTATFSSATALASLASLSATNSTLTGTNGLTVAGTSLFNSSTLSTTGTYTAGGQTTISVGGLTMNATVFAANGGVILTGPVSLANAAQFQNNGTNLMDIQGGNGFTQGVMPLGTLTSTGTIQNSSSGTTFLAVTLNISGPINVNAGTLNLDGTGMITSAITVAPGTMLGLGAGSNGGMLNLTAASSVSGAGTVMFRDPNPGNVNLAGTYNITGGTSVLSTGTYNFTGPVLATGPITAGSGTLNFSSSSPSVAIASIHLTCGTIAGSSNLNVAGAFTWDCGTVKGNGNVATSGTLTASGGITMSVSNIVILDGKTLTANSAGTPVTQGGNTTLDLENGAIFNLAAGTTYNMQSPSGIATASTGTFNNAGTFVRNGALAGATPINVPFNNTGSVNDAVSELDFNAGMLCAPAASCNGSITVSGILQLTAATYNLGGSITINSGAAMNAVGGGTVNFVSGATVSGAGGFFVGNTVTLATGAVLGNATVTVISGGTLRGTGTLGTMGGPLTNLSMGAGTVHPGASPGILTVNGNYTQTGGTLSIDLGGTTAGSGYSQLVVNGTAMLGGVLGLNQFGGFTQSAGNKFVVVLPTTYGGGTFAAITSGTLPASPALAVSTYSAAPTGVVLQAAGGCNTWTGPATGGDWGASGTNWSKGNVPVAGDDVCIPGGDSVSMTTALPLANQTIHSLTTTAPGTLTITTSPNFTVTTTAMLGQNVTIIGTTVNFNGPVTSSGTFTGSGGTVNFNPGATVSAFGPLVISGATLFFNSGSAVPLTTVSLSAGQLTSIDMVNIGGLFTWTGGGVNGAINANGGISVPGGSSLFVFGGTLNNSGTATFSGAPSTLTFANLNDQIVNLASGTIDFQNDSLITINGASNGKIVNQGTLKKSAGATSTTFQAELDNNGTVLVQAATLLLAGGSTSTGAWNIASGATLLINPPVPNSCSCDGYQFSGNFLGSGTLRIALGFITFNAGATSAATLALNLTGGDLILNGASLNFSSVNITGGVLAGGGTIISTVSNTGGTVEPSIATLNAAGAITITGNYTQGAGGTLSLFINGLTAGTGYSQLVVSGTANITGTITGTLNSFMGTFTPPAGSVITPLTAGVPVAGTFTTNSLQAPAPDSWALTYNTNAPAGNVVATLQAPPAPMIAAAPNPLAFGNQPKGVASSALTLTFSNGGNAPLMITGGLVPTGGNAADFAQVAGAGTCGAAPITIAAGGTCTVQYTFTPSIAGAESTTLAVANNSTTNPYIVMLTGTGILPVVTFAPTAAAGVNFGAVPPMTTSAPMTVTATVTAGTGTLQLTAITITPTGTGTGATDFAIVAASTTCPTGGGAVMTSCVVSMTFTPSIAGNESANLTFAGTNLTGSPVNIPLTGVGASTAAGFTLTASSATGGNGTVVSILPGDTATFTIVVQPNPGFIGMISIMCVSGIPATIATANPATINVTTTPAPPTTVTCTLQTNCVPSLVAPRGPWNAPPWTPPPFAGVLLLAVLLAAQWRKQRPANGRAFVRQLAPVLGMVLLVVMMMTWTACVSNPPRAIPGAPTTPAGVYQIQLVGTAAGGVKSVISLTVHII